MPFERYLQQDDNNGGDAEYANQEYLQPAHPSLSYHNAQHHPYSRPIQFQMPQFMLGGPPTLAPGGGAEVLPSGFLNEPGSMTSAWLTNSGFTPNVSHDGFSAPLKYYNHSQSNILSPQSSAAPTTPAAPLPPAVSAHRRLSLTVPSSFDPYAPHALPAQSPLPTPSSGSVPSSFMSHAGFAPNSAHFGTILPPSIPSALGLPVYSTSGFDLLSILARVATRPNPKIALGPVDLSCSFVVVDVRRHDSPVVYASPTFCRLTGYVEHEVLGRNCRFLQAPDGNVTRGEQRRHTGADAVAYMRKSLVADKECQTSMINYRKDGSAFINLITVIPIAGGVSGSPEESEDVVFHVGFQVDLTEQPKAILHKLRDGSYINDPSLGAPLQPRERRQNAFAINAVSHDLKTLLGDEHFLKLASPTVANEDKSEWHEGNQPLSLMLLDATPDFLLVLSLKGSFLYVAPSVRRALGFGPDDLVGKSVADYCHPSDVVPLMRELKESSTANPAPGEGQPGLAMFTNITVPPKSVNLLFRAHAQDGKYVWLECRGRLHVEPGKGRKAIILSARARSMPCLDWTGVPSTGLGPGPGGGGGAGEAGEVWGMLSTGGTVLFMGASVKEFIGWGVGEAIGMSVGDFIVGARQDLEAALQRVAASTSGVPESVVCRVRRKDGDAVDLTVVLYPPPPPPTTQELGYSRLPSNPIVCQFKYMGAGGFAMSEAPSSSPPPGTIGNVFEELETSRNSSWQYELQQLKIANQRLMTDIDAMETTVQSQEQQLASSQRVSEPVYPVHPQPHTLPHAPPLQPQAHPHSHLQYPQTDMYAPRTSHQDWGSMQQQPPPMQHGNPLKRRWDAVQQDHMQ